MRVVDHHGGSVLLGECADVGEVGDVPVNGEYAVHHNKRSRAGRDRGKARLETGHVVVLEAQHLAEAHAGRRIDARVVVDVADQVVVAAYERAYDAEVRLEAGAERDRVLLADKVRELAFKLEVEVERAVEEARA